MSDPPRCTVIARSGATKQSIRACLASGLLRFGRNDVGGETSEAHLVVNVRDVAGPVAVIALEKQLGGRGAARDDLAQGVEEAAFIVAGGVEPGPGDEAGFG